MADASLCQLDGLTLSGVLHRREASCRELMQATLARIDRLNPIYNAIVSMRDPDALLAQADQYDQELAQGHSRGWMHGFPHAVKDLSPTAGITTTWGSPLYRNLVPTTDGLLAERLRGAGAILIGKTNTPEWGLGSQTYNPVFGATRNAYDPSKTSGGSSGGAAVALALRLQAVADGSDMGGSLRNPAAWNNVYGLRPSRGRVPMWPAEDAFFQQLGIEGPMARTVLDLAALLHNLAGPDRRAPLALDADPAACVSPLEVDAAHWRQVRIGWLGDLEGHLATEPGVLAQCEAGLQQLAALGCSVAPARLGFEPERLWQSFVTLRAAAMAGRFAPLRAQPAQWAQLKPEAQWEVERGNALSALDLHRASVDRTAFYHQVCRLFESFDLLVLPSAQCFAFDVHQHWPTEIAGRSMDSYHRWMEVVVGPTMAGLPVVNLPTGFDASGRPMGVQLIGPPKGELGVLQAARAHEVATGWVTRHPPAVD